MDKNLGQLFWIGLEGKDISSDEESFLIENNIGGVVLFERNMESPQQLHSLCQNLQKISKKQKDQAPLLIATDMEGGRIATLKEPFTVWPSSQKLASIDSASTAFQMSQAMGTELNAVGFNVNFAPCVDTLTNPKNDLIGDRSPSSDPDVVGKVTSALIRGWIKAQVLPCAKHYPGHGNTIVDSHEELPTDDISKEDLYNKLLPPFKKSFKARLDFVMTAHVRYPCIDSDWPATLSEKFLKDILRDELRYRNLVIADDLMMSALSKNYDLATVAKRSLQAGVDMLMYCHQENSHQEPFHLLQEAIAKKEVDASSVAKSHEMILKLKKNKLEKVSYPSWEEAQKLIGCSEHQKISEAIAAGEAVEVVKE